MSSYTEKFGSYFPKLRSGSPEKLIQSHLDQRQTTVNPEVFKSLSSSYPPRNKPEGSQKSFFKTVFDSESDNESGESSGVKLTERTPLLGLAAQNEKRIREKIQREELLKQEQEKREEEEMVNSRTTLIQERTQGIENLSTDIKTIKEIMDDLNRMTEEQSPYLESIEANIVTGSDRIEKGTGELVKAKKHQKKRRKLLSYLIGAGTLVISGAVIALGVTLGHH